MERVAFLIERTGDTVACMMNPEGLLRRRAAGLAERQGVGGLIIGDARRDNPLIATGGGITEIDLELLFDADVAQEGAQAGGNAQNSPDIRKLTEQFWQLSENGTEKDAQAPPVLRFIWGTAWNVPCSVLFVAERLEHFDANGCPRRSWMSLRLRRVSEEQSQKDAKQSGQQQRSGAKQSAAGSGTGETSMPLDGDGGPLERFDEVAAREYGDPELAWALAGANAINDPLTVKPVSGTQAQIALPPRSALTGVLS